MDPRVKPEDEERKIIFSPPLFIPDVIGNPSVWVQRILWLK